MLWLNHHWVLEQVVQVDGPLLLLNLNMLLWTAPLPFPTAVLAEHLGAGGEAARTAAALYSGVLVLLALAGVALFAWVIHDDRLHRLPPATVAATRRQFLIGLAIYVVAFVLSWVSPLLGLAVCGRWRSTTAATTCAVDQAPTLAEPDHERSSRSASLVSRSVCAAAHPAGVVLLACAIICFKALAQPPW